MAYQGNLLSKTLVIGIIFLFIVIGTFNIVASTSLEKQRLVTQNNSSKQGGIILITECDSNRIIEVDINGNIVWEYSTLNSPWDAERLGNGNTLIAESGNNRVIEVDSNGTIVWEKDGLDVPFDAERLVNGNTLIAESGNNRVIEVDSNGTIVWEKGDLNMPVDAERLVNGKTLVAETEGSRVIEVDAVGTIVWEYAVLYKPWDVERLANGNTLITDSYNNRVIEVDTSGTVVWEKGTYYPIDAERFANGNTLITLCLMYRVIEVDSSDMIVWFKTQLNFPTDAERINAPPTAPTIDGQTSGKPEKEYEYTFNAEDSDGDDVKYYIDWGDNNIEWTGYNASSTDVKVNHMWSEKETYIIKAKAEDTNGLVGPEATLTVTVPRSRAIFNSMFQLLFDRFPLLEVFLRAMNLVR